MNNDIAGVFMEKKKRKGEEEWLRKCFTRLPQDPKSGFWHHLWAECGYSRQYAADGSLLNFWFFFVLYTNALQKKH